MGIMSGVHLALDRVSQYASQNASTVFIASLGIWWVGALLAIFVPVSRWRASRRAYYQMYGQAIEYEQQQRAYEQQGQNNNDGNQYNQYNYGYQPCKWYQFKCRKTQREWREYQQQQRQQNGGSGDSQQIFTPGWYQFLGGKQGEDDRREREEAGIVGEEAGGTKFVYGWTLALFLGVVIAGSVFMFRHYRLNAAGSSQKASVPFYYASMLLMLFFMLQYSLALLVLVPQGVITTDDRDLEDSIYGWYGQWPVLLLYFEFAQCIFAAVGMVLCGVALFFLRRGAQGGLNNPITVEDGATTGDKPASATNYGRFM